ERKSHEHILNFPPVGRNESVTQTCLSTIALSWRSGCFAPLEGARLESGGRRDSSAKRLESERMPYARQGALLWGSLVSCGRLAIGQLPRLHGIAAVANRRAGCRPAPRHGS